MEIIRVTEVSDEIVRALDKLMLQLTPDRIPLTEDYLKSVVSQNHIHLFVAWENGEMAGAFTLFFFQLLSGRKVSLEDVVVDSNMRGKKIGEKMIAFAIDYSVEELKVNKIDLTTNPSRLAANALYLKMGFKQRETNVYRWESF